MANMSPTVSLHALQTAIKGWAQWALDPSKHTDTQASTPLPHLTAASSHCIGIRDVSPSPGRHVYLKRGRKRFFGCCRLHSRLWKHTTLIFFPTPRGGLNYLHDKQGDVVSASQNSPIAEVRRQTSLPGRLNLEIGARAYSDSILIANVSTQASNACWFLLFICRDNDGCREIWAVHVAKVCVGGVLSDHRAVFVLVGVVAIQGSDGEMMRDQCSESL